MSRIIKHMDEIKTDGVSADPAIARARQESKSSKRMSEDVEFRNLTRALLTNQISQEQYEYQMKDLKVSRALV